MPPLTAREIINLLQNPKDLHLWLDDYDPSDWTTDEVREMATIASSADTQLEILSISVKHFDSFTIIPAQKLLQNMLHACLVFILHVIAVSHSCVTSAPARYTFRERAER